MLRECKGKAEPIPTVTLCRNPQDPAIGAELSSLRSRPPRLSESDGGQAITPCPPATARHERAGTRHKYQALLNPNIFNKL